MAGSITKDLIDVSLTTTANTSIGDWVAASEAIDTEVYKQASTIGTDGSYNYQTGKNTLATAIYTPPVNINMTANYTTPHLYWSIRCDVMTFCEDLNTGATNSGHMVRVTDGAGNWTQWHVSGANVWDGGWKTFVLDLTNTTDIHSSSGVLSLADVDIITFYTDNSNSGNIRIIDNTWLDAIRYGDGLQVQSTTTEAFGFSNIALDDGLVANYYGVQQEIDGVLFTQGGIVIGDAVGSGTCNLVSLNETLYFRDQLVSVSHYLLTGVASATATTDIDIAGMVCKTVGDSGGELTFAAADLNSMVIAGSTFINMGTVTLTYISAEITGTKFSGCGTIELASGVIFTECEADGCGILIHAGADTSGTKIKGFEGTANTSGLIYDVAVDPDGEMDGMEFSQGTTLTHAIEFGVNVPTAMTLRDCIFTGYSSTQDVNNSTFHFKDTSGTITLNIIGGSGNVGYRTDGATIVIVQDPVTTTVTSQTVDQTKVQNARVYLRASDALGPLPYQISISITQSAGTATVTHTTHGFSTNQYVSINGAVEEEYNKVVQITVIDANTYTYSVDSGASSPATGSPVCTGVIVYGLTDVNGEVSDSRTLGSDQNVSGWVRKSTSSPFYKSSPLGGTVSSEAGANFTAIMISDE